MKDRRPASPAPAAPSSSASNERSAALRAPEGASGDASVGVGLRDAVANVGELAGELVHALRNPVSALTTSLELLTGGLADADDIPQLHRVMRNELTRLNELLGRCRDLTRLTHLEMAPLDLAALARTRLEARAEEVASRKVTLRLALPEGAVPLRGDATQLGTALDALVTNALEAMPEGGALEVALATDARGATLRLRDTGHGIPANALPNVFRLFYTTRKGAAGMGLPLARQVVLAHGGTIRLESTEGQGTTATVQVPLGE